jgi:flagellar hook-length control protein FliK
LATDQNRIQGIQFSNETTFLGENNEKINLTLNSFGAENGFIVNSLAEKLGSTGKIDPNSEKDGMTPFTEAKNQGVDRFLALDGQEAHQRIISSEPGEMKSDHGVSPLKTDPLEIYQQIGKQVLWSIKNGEEKIKLALDPPHLGNIYMEINREKENIKATLWTDNPATKEILETHQIQLQKILGEDGFKLEKFNVLVQHDMGSFQQQGERSIHNGPWRKRGFEEGKSLSPEPLEVSPLVANFSHRGSIYVDIFV